MHNATEALADAAAAIMMERDAIVAALAASTLAFLDEHDRIAIRSASGSRWTTPSLREWVVRGIDANGEAIDCDHHLTLADALRAAQHEALDCGAATVTLDEWTAPTRVEALKAARVEVGPSWSCDREQHEAFAVARDADGVRALALWHGYDAEPESSRGEYWTPLAVVLWNRDGDPIGNAERVEEAVAAHRIMRRAFDALVDAERAASTE